LHLPPGTTGVAAVFQGTTSYSASISAAQNMTVTGGSSTSTTAIAATGTTGNYTITGTVSATNYLSLAGTVSFLDTSNGNYNLGSASTGPNEPAWTAATSLSVGSGPQGIAEGDFNGDGKMDLAICNSSSNTVSIFLGNGDGTFTAGTALSAGLSDPRQIVAGDFNGDGKIDLAVANLNTVSIFLGTGSGTFTTGTALNLGTAQPQGLAIGDFNGDGIQDLVFFSGAAGFNDEVTVYLGTGTGTFTKAEQMYTGGVYGWNPPLVGDFNGDGIQDFVELWGQGSANPEVFLGEGNGFFTTPYSVPTMTGCDAGVVGDFNRDGKLDIAAVCNNVVYVALGNGDGTFNTSLVTTLPGTGYRAMVKGDFNGDGITDLAFGSYSTPSTVSILLGNGDGTFTVAPAPTLVGADAISGLVTGDFNGDGKPDLAATNNYNNTVSVELDQGPSATATISGVTVYGGGVHNVLASYSGNGNFTASQSGTIPLNGTLIPTTTTLFLSPGTTEPYGTNLQWTGSIAPYVFGTYTASGNVNFYDAGTTLLGSGAVSSGQGIYSTNSLSQGSYSITANYAGDTNFAASTSAAQGLTITKITPVITWPTPAAITYGTALSATQLNATSGGVAGTFAYNPGIGTVLSAGLQTLNVTFTPTNGAMYNTATGTVQIQVNPAGLTVKANNASRPFDTANPSLTCADSGFVNGDTTASLTTQATGTTTAVLLSPAGSYPISCAGAVDPNYSFSYVAGTLTITKVILVPITTFSLVSSPNPSTYGSSVIFTATAPPLATGTVQFYDNGVAMGSPVVVSSGVAAYSTSTLPVGTQTITAVYSGDTNYAGVTSSPLSQVITKGSVTFTVGSSVNPSTYGSPATLTITCTGSEVGVTPTGNLTISDSLGWTAPGPVSLVAGVGTLTTSTLPVGTNTLTIVYNGDVNYQIIKGNGSIGKALISRK
jgi:hypothetical protein